MQVSAVAAVGIAEGVSHVNWRLLAKILLWWVAGFCLTMIATSALIAQGESIHLTDAHQCYCTSNDGVNVSSQQHMIGTVAGCKVWSVS